MNGSLSNASGELEPKNDVVARFFEDYPILIAEEKLWDFCMAKMTLGEPFNYGSPSDDLLFYESLQQLLQRLKAMETTSRWPYLVTPGFTEQTLVSVEGVVNFIKQAIPVGTIYNLSKNKEVLDLIVVLEKGCASAYAAYDEILEMSVLGYPKGTCTLHNYGLLNTLIRNGHFFYASACVEENVVYRKSTAELFPPVNYDEGMLLETQQTFTSGMQKVADFYSGAQHYLNDANYEMTAFMLQQCTELTYRCLLNVLRGRDVKCHSPAALRKHLKRFAPEIIGVFAEHEETELAHLQILEDAYVKARYHPGYQVDRELTEFLNNRVAILQSQALKLFTDRLTILDQLLKKPVSQQREEPTGSIASASTKSQMQ